MGIKKPRSLTTSGFFGVASIKDAQYGCGGRFFIRVICCFSGVTRKATQYFAFGKMDPDARGKTTFLFTLKILKHGVSFAHTATACSVRTAEAVRFKPHPRLAEGKQNEKSTHKGCFFVLVAGVGFEPHDLRVMSPTSYQAALPRDMKLKNGAGSRDRTGTILSITGF